MTNLLSINNIIIFHEKIIKQTGGSTGIRDKGLIESALNRAFASYDGKDLYPSDIDKMNNIKVSYTQQELIGLGIKTAEGVSKEKDILNWINEHIVN